MKINNSRTLTLGEWKLGFKRGHTPKFQNIMDLGALCTTLNRLVYQKGEAVFNDFMTVESHHPFTSRLKVKALINHLRSLDPKEIPHEIVIHEYGVGNANNALEILNGIRLTEWYPSIKYILIDQSWPLLKQASLKLMGAGHAEKFSIVNSSAEFLPLGDEKLQKGEVFYINFNELYDDLRHIHLVKRRNAYFQIYVTAEILTNLFQNEALKRNSRENLWASLTRFSIEDPHPVNLLFRQEVDWGDKLKEIEINPLALPFGDLIKEQLDAYPEGQYIPIPLGAINTLRGIKYLLHNHGYAETNDYGFDEADFKNQIWDASGSLALGPGVSFYWNQPTTLVNFWLLSKAAGRLGLNFTLKPLAAWIQEMTGKPHVRTNLFITILNDPAAEVLANLYQQGKLKPFISKDELGEILNLVKHKGITLERLTEYFETTLNWEETEGQIHKHLKLKQNI